ncbi:MAG: hypothetical protein WA865_04260 [Spirulinaceae cyanobacterium]
MSKLTPSSLIKWLAVTGVAWSAGYLYNVHFGGELSWLKAVYNEKMALAEEVDAPRRLLTTGGSGAHYSINSEVLEQEVGIPVINLGIDGRLGLNVILDSIIEKIRPGDVVLLIPEYSMVLLDEDGLAERSADFGLAIGKPGLGGVPAKDLAHNTLLLGVPSLRSLTKAAVDLATKGEITGYYSDPITKKGDPTTVKQRAGKWWKMSVNQSISPSSHSFKRIKQFRQDLEAKGAHLVISLPWVYAKTDGETVDNVGKIAQELEKIAPVIYDEETLNLQSNAALFADTHYHLQLDVMEKRSLQIAEQIEPILQSLPEAKGKGK